MLVKNNAYASTSGSISSGSSNPLTITVASGQGSRFSTITAGSGRWFMAALVDEPPNNVEIVHVYQHDSGSPDTFVCLRARDGTTAKDWSGGTTFMQISDTESGWGDNLDRFQLKGTVTAGGLANAITASVPCGYQSLINGMEFAFNSAAANTGAATLAVTFDHSTFGGTTYAQSAKPLVKENFVALEIGDIPSANYPARVKWVAAQDKFLLMNPANLKVGRVEMLAHGNVPTGWLTCDGSQVAVATYPLLAAALGTTWGSLTNGSGGAGSSHFRLPDMRGRSPVGYGQGATAEGGATGTSRSVGQTGGAETHTLTASQLAPHSHAVGTAQPNAFAAGSSKDGAVLSGTAINSSNNTPSGSPHNNMHPFGVFHFIIRAA